MTLSETTKHEAPTEAADLRIVLLPGIIIDPRDRRTGRRGVLSRQTRWPRRHTSRPDKRELS